MLLLRSIAAKPSPSSSHSSAPPSSLRLRLDHATPTFVVAPCCRSSVVVCTARLQVRRRAGQLVLLLFLRRRGHRLLGSSYGQKGKKSQEGALRALYWNRVAPMHSSLYLGGQRAAWGHFGCRTARTAARFDADRQRLVPRASGSALGHVPSISSHVGH